MHINILDLPLAEDLDALRAIGVEVAGQLQGGAVELGGEHPPPQAGAPRGDLQSEERITEQVLDGRGHGRPSGRQIGARRKGTAATGPCAERVQYISTAVG